MRQYIYMGLALPILCLAWFLLASGLYHLASSIAAPSETNEFAEFAVWEFMFAFGVTSVAALLASRVKFLSMPLVRKVFLYSLVLSSVLFLGYSVIGVVLWFIHVWSSS
jgi:uncharacterized membrane protein